MDRKFITLKNLMIEQGKCIGLKFYTDKVVQALVNDLPEVRWSEEYSMNYIANSPANLDSVSINAIRFYYEVVLEMPNLFYAIERPRPEEKLPQVLAKEEVLSMIENTNNIKHRCIVSLLYSTGLRRAEFLNLKPEDIDGKRMFIKYGQVKEIKTGTPFFLKNLWLN